MPPAFGKILILFGVVFIGLGLILSVNAHLPWLGKLPGDIVVKKENFQFYFPFTTCLLVSAVLSLFLYVFRK